MYDLQAGSITDKKKKKNQISSIHLNNNNNMKIDMRLIFLDTKFQDIIYLYKYN